MLRIHGSQATKKIMLSTENYEEIKLSLLERLRLMSSALSQPRNPSVNTMNEVKVSELDKSEAKVFNSIQKYSEIKPQRDNLPALTDSNQSREELLNVGGENFFKELEKFLAIANNIPFKKKIVNKKEKKVVNKKVVLGAIFNSHETVTQCLDLLTPFITEIKTKNIFDLISLKELPKKTKNHEYQIRQLESEKKLLETKLENILKPLKTTELVKAKIKKLLFKSKKSQLKCIQFLEEISECVKAFDQLRLCLNILNTAGFYNVNGRSINFWSGTQAQAHADSILNSASDSNVPAISFFSYIGYLLKMSRQRNLSDVVFTLISAEFASQASGDIQIFSSTSSKYEKPTFTVSNFHWEIELPILLMLQAEETVGVLQVFFYDPSTKEWSIEPRILLEDVEMNYANRRPSDPNATAGTNLVNRKIQEEEGPPRPCVNLNKNFINSNEADEKSSTDYSPRSSSVSDDSFSPSLPLKDSSYADDSLSPRTRTYLIISDSCKKISQSPHGGMQGIQKESQTTSNQIITFLTSSLSNSTPTPPSSDIISLPAQSNNVSLMLPLVPESEIKEQGNGRAAASGSTASQGGLWKRNYSKATQADPKASAQTLSTIKNSKKSSCVLL